MGSPPTIPGIEIGRCLGGGPLTAVYAARRSDGVAVAIKCPREGWSGHADAVALLRREARALQAVNDRHVVRLLDSHLTSVPYFLAIEFLPGETLRHRLQRDYALNLGDALWMLRQVAEGLQAIHYAGFSNGDIKPENVQILLDGSAVILDLGFAHPPNAIDRLCGPGYLLSTAGYAAPEDKRTFAADWFSFGVMAFEMLTGRLPGFDVALPSLPERLRVLLDGLLSQSAADRPTGPLVVHELIALEIGALRRRAG